MTTKDDPRTRIKARDAQAVFEVQSTLRDAAPALLMMVRHRFKVVGMVRRRHGRVETDVAAEDTRGAEIMRQWVDYEFAAAKLPAAPLPAEGVVILAIRDDGRCDAATWGADAAACLTFAKWRDRLVDAVMPKAPFQTYFGWGTEGRPRRMDPNDLAQLTIGQREYVARCTHPDATA